MDVQGGNVEIESQSGRNCVVSVHCVRDKKEVRVGHGGVRVGERVLSIW